MIQSDYRRLTAGTAFIVVSFGHVRDTYSFVKFSRHVFTSQPVGSGSGNVWMVGPIVC